MAGHSNAKTTGLYDRRNDDIRVGEVDRIGILINNGFFPWPLMRGLHGKLSSFYGILFRANYR
jgi:hypothetical protein